MYRSDAAEQLREEHIENRAEYQRPKNADRHVTSWIARFLCCGRDGIESDVSEEHDTGRPENSKNTAVMMRDALRCDVRRRRRNEWRVIRWVDELPAASDEEQHNG